MLNRKATVRVITPDTSDKNINLGYINPNATNANLKDFVTSAVGLTQNSYVGTTITDTYSLDEIVP